MQRDNSKRRVSTFNWISKGQERHRNHENIIDQFENCYNHGDEIDHNQKPVNILCFDGGGMKGE